MFEVILYQDDKGNSPVQAYIEGLSKKQQNKMLAYIDRLAEFGFNLKRPTADSLGSGLGLYELRPEKDG